MVNEHRCNKIPYDEYFLFKYDEIFDTNKRHSFVSDYERVEISNKLNLPENDPIFYDKEITYQTFQHFYLRDVLRHINPFKRFPQRIFGKEHDDNQSSIEDLAEINKQLIKNEL